MSTKIAIFGNDHQKEEQIRKIVEALMKHDVEIFLEESFHDYLCSTYNIFCNTGGIIKGRDFHTDLVISIGGDGTFLRTAAKIGNKQIPILGVNTGRLGFLADTPYNDFDKALNEIFDNKYKVEDRTQLRVEIAHVLDEDSYIALNEVAILKQDSASMINVSITVNGDFLTNYEADGLLISTPTGSTAYAMSIGGPILSPTLSSFILSPIASHTLTSRPLLIDDNSNLSLKIKSRNDHYLLSLDGRSTILPTDVEFKVRKASYPLKVIRREGQNFYKTLRNKLMWGADPRENK